MNAEGPQLDLLLHRLADCPPEFQAEPHRGQSGTIDVAAVVCDHFREMNAFDESAEENTKVLRGFGKTRQQLIAITTWLLHEGWFLERPELASDMWSLLLGDKLGELSRMLRPEMTVTDPDRREELVRVSLNALGLRPQGESMAQATDRLTTLDSVERERVVRKTRAAEARAREIREQMAAQAAEEAAARYSRE